MSDDPFLLAPELVKACEDFNATLTREAAPIIEALAELGEAWRRELLAFLEPIPTRRATSPATQLDL